MVQDVMAVALKYEGAPCAEGHTLRYSKNDLCVQCVKNRGAEYYRKNKQVMREKNKRYVAENKDRVKAYLSGYNARPDVKAKERVRGQSEAYKQTGKEFRANNKKKLAKRKAADRAKNPEKFAIKEKLRWANRKNKGPSAALIAKFQRRRAAKMGAEGSHTYAEFLAVLRGQGYKCAACSTRLNKHRHADHILPLSRGGSDYISNIQALCPACNLSKGSKTMQEWQEHKAKMAQFLCEAA